MAIEIVDLPSWKMVIFHSYVNVYQRVFGLYIYVYIMENPIKMDDLGGIP